MPPLHCDFGKILLNLVIFHIFEYRQIHIWIMNIRSFRGNIRISNFIHTHWELYCEAIGRYKQMNFLVFNEQLIIIVTQPHFPNVNRFTTPFSLQRSTREGGTSGDSRVHPASAIAATTDPRRGDGSDGQHPRSGASGYWSSNSGLVKEVQTVQSGRVRSREWPHLGFRLKGFLGKF